MLLHEFEVDNRDMILLTGVISQILNRIEDTGFDRKYSLKSMLNTLSERGLDIDREQFISMIKKQPLSNLISNVKGDTVVFKGEESDEDDEAMAPDDTTDTLEKMAKKAAKKREI